MDTQIQLGKFIFRNLEIPEFINFGGEQLLVQHDLIGGNRVIDSLGKSDTDIKWTGLITGSDSMSRAIQLNQMRVAGQSLLLTWFSLNYTVIIQSVSFRTQRFYQIEYDISLRVLTDGANPNNNNIANGFNEAINGDYNTITNILNNITPAATNPTNPNVDINNNPVTPTITNITSSMKNSIDNLGNAISHVSNFNGASSKITAPVSNAIQDSIKNINSNFPTIEQILFGVT